MNLNDTATRDRARRRNREHLRRTSLSDITPEQEIAMRRKTRKCPMPGCGKWMTDKPHLPNSKELDHILPINQGGTHTHGNVRIICRECNQKRPKDGSDYAGTLTLWAQGEVPISRPDGRREIANTRKTCRKGLHPWIPENIMIRDGHRRCKLCAQASDRVKPLRECRCGALFPAPGSQHMCPACIDKAAREAAELHATTRMTWDQIAAQVGYNSAEGARYAAKRIGYEPVARPPEPKQKKQKQQPQRLCACGGVMPPGQRGPNHSRCDECIRSAAWRAVEMRRTGMTLRQIADVLGYSSITTVTNLMKTVAAVRPSPARHAASGVGLDGHARAGAGKLAWQAWVATQAASQARAG